MNVRFFAGTKADYLSLPTPRNPLGLYFCADTRELFWADRLLTDGTRVVATEADLPNPEKAAEGITYYVEETRNGYVLSSDRTKWIQVIYAPEAGSSSVKAISFAGIEMEEVDGVFTIDRRCAREALGFIVPDGMEGEELEIATKDYVDSQIAAIPGADVDLSEYATKADLSAIEAKIPSDYLTAIPSEYITETELNEAIENIENTYVTNKTLEEKNYVTEAYVTNNYITAQAAADTYVTSEKVTEVVETQVETVIQEKVDAGEITVRAGSVSYDTW